LTVWGEIPPLSTATPITGLPEIPDLWRHLRDLLRQIPRVHVSTFGDLADALPEPLYGADRFSRAAARDAKVE
jgi:hypothetical protein